jgi:XrtJ-associated TM-motif-TM protein
MINLKKSLACTTLLLTNIALITQVHAQSGGGCVDSPENPTIVLAAIGLTAASARWLKKRFERPSTGPH